MEENKQLALETEKIQIKTCAFTGHRKLEKDFSEEKTKREIESLIRRGVEIFYNGMAIGFDLFAAETVLSLKKEHPNVKIVACIPFYGQEMRFSETDKKRYANVLKEADEQIVLAEHYYRGCMQNRDRYMADRADVMLAYCKKKTGGAAFTAGYFQKKYPGKEIIFL